MFQRLSAFRRHADLDSAAFRKYWREVHGPMLPKVAGLVKYRQNHVVDASQRVTHGRGPDEVDGFAQLWFASEADMRRASEATPMRAANADLVNFMSAISLFTCETNEVVAPPAPSPKAKRMTLLYGKPGMSLDRFRQHWFAEHAPMVARFPRLRGYSQHLVTAHLPVSMPGMRDAGIRPQGILEMWFDTIADMDAAFASPAAKETIAHGGVFLAAATTYVVEEIPIIP